MRRSATDDWAYACSLTQTVTAQELATLKAQPILYRLFHQNPPHVLVSDNIEFACTCSRDKVGNMLLMLGSVEAGSILKEQGSIAINCDFCHTHYVFDEAAANALFGINILTTYHKHSSQ